MCWRIVFFKYEFKLFLINIFEMYTDLNGNKYDIAFKLPMHEKEQNLIDLLASHSEFKRPYSFIANKSKVIIKDYNDVVLESFLIINKDFKEIYNKPNNN